MSDINPEQVKAIFLAAVELDPAQRAAFLDRECAGNAALRREVEALLAANKGKTLLKTLTMTVEAKPAGAVLPAGTRVGGYTILREIGRGGMGVVYEAEQENPRRHVALKVINPGITSAQALRRFEHEAEILGRLRHPGIAQIYEAGTFDVGSGSQPFFAMEYVEGMPLGEYAEVNKLSTRQRLELIVRICQAVQHAHAKGVIHRDLKPGNILVVTEPELQTPGPHGVRAASSDQSPNVKVLDFGVARATDSDLQSSTLRSDIGQLIGTIPYMSPEQAGGDHKDLDTRSDVYALGVVAYELLAGRLPHDLKEMMIHEAVRVIREDDPTPLSSINRTLRGDVEIVIGKALAKEKERRYQSAQDFAGDIERYLSDKPIDARPPSTWYQFSKFARRNRALVGGAAATFVVLVAGLVGTSYGLKQAVAAREKEVEQRRIAEANELRATEEAERAEREAAAAREQAEIAEAINQFLNKDLLQAVAPSLEEGRGVDVLMRDVLEEASRRIDAESKPGGRFADKPLIEASIRATLAWTFNELGLGQHAEPHIIRALELRRAHLGEEHVETMQSMHRLAYAYVKQGKQAEALQLYEETLELRRRVLGMEDPDTLSTMIEIAGAKSGLGLYAEAEQIYHEVLSIKNRVLGADDSGTLKTLHDLGTSYYAQGKIAEAANFFEMAFEGLRRTAGMDDYITLHAMGSLANTLNDQGMYHEAERLYEEVLEHYRRVMGPEHQSTLRIAPNLAIAYNRQGRHDEAQKLLEETLDVQRRVLGSEHPDAFFTMRNLAIVYSNIGNNDDAQRMHEEVLEAQRRVLGPEHPKTLQSLAGLAQFHQRLGNDSDAHRLFEELLAISTRVLGPQHRTTQDAKLYFAARYHREKKYSAAQQLYEEVLEYWRSNHLIENTAGQRHMSHLGIVYYDQGKYTDAERTFSEVLEVSRRNLESDHPLTLTTMSNLGNAYAGLKKYADAESIYKEALAIYKRLNEDEHPHGLHTKRMLAIVYSDQGKHEDAQRIYKELLEIRRRIDGPERNESLLCMNGLADLYMSQCRYADALRLNEEIWEIRKRIHGPEHKESQSAMYYVADCYKKQENYVKSGQLFEERLKLRQSADGPEHRSTLWAMHQLALNYNEHGKYADALRILDEKLAIERRVLGDEHEATLYTKNVLANVLVLHGKHIDGHDLHHETLEIRRRVLGPEHSETLWSVNNLGWACTELGRYEEAERYYQEALETRIRISGYAHADTNWVRSNLITLYNKQERADLARPIAVELHQILCEAADAPFAKVAAINAYASALLTTEPEDLRDPVVALEYAKRAVAISDEQSPAILDTLALAYHMTDDHELAVKTQEKALALLPEDESPLRKSLETNMARFRDAIKQPSNTKQVEEFAPTERGELEIE